MWIGIALIALSVLLIFGKKATAETIEEAKKTVTLNELIINYSKEFSIPEALIKAIIKQESNWDINAKNPADPSYGLMQVMPITFQDAGIIKDYKNVTPQDIENMLLPINNLFAGCWQLHRLMKKYDMWIAVEMYNVGERGYNELNRRNSVYVSRVKSFYTEYMENPNG